MERANLKISKFNFKLMKENCTIGIIAKRGSGKSILVQDLLYFFNKIPVGMIIAPTDKMTKFYSSIYPDTYIYYKFRTEKLASLLARQEKIIEKKDRKKKKGEPCKIDTRSCLVMDDCLADKKLWVRDENISTIFMNGRHFGITIMFTLQYPIGIPPDLRSNIDYVFLLADDNVSNLKKLYDNYAGVFPDFKTFRETFKELTKDYGILVINNRAGANAEFSDKVFWYRVDIDKEEKKLGCSQFNDFHNKNYNPLWEKDNAYATKSGKATLSIQKVNKGTTNKNREKER